MALLAEEIVEEWLNRQGYFTIRGVKLGVHELDLLAIKVISGSLHCRHVEVQVSVHPVSYLMPLSKVDQKATGRGRTSSAQRTDGMHFRSADEWVERKFGMKDKVNLLAALAPGPWSRELVVHKVKHPEELDMLRARGIEVHFLEDVFKQTLIPERMIEQASGGALLDLMQLADPSLKVSDL